MKKRRSSILFKSLFGILLMLLVFSTVVSIIGYRGFTESLMEQYTDGSFRIAAAAELYLDLDRFDEYTESGGTTEFYLKTHEQLETLCNYTGSTFIYLIFPDTSDYEHITFIFSTINYETKFTRYEFGFVRNTTNDEYKQKYRKLYEGLSDEETVVRDAAGIETDRHITAMRALRDSSGTFKGILCVQRQMEGLAKARGQYLLKVTLALVVITVIVFFAQAAILNLTFLKPITIIEKETIRFAEDNVKADPPLISVIKNRDEIGVLASSIDTMEEQIVDYFDDLTKVTSEKERLSTELSLASKIQTSMIPSTFPAFPDRKDFEIYASMIPAREVGGDFYDFFLVDDDHLCIVIADVSGKGVPAALFMMATKILIANFAKMGKSPCEVLTAANEAICKNNKQEMFVTVWLGIIELSTGKLVSANAGHEYPIIMNAGGFFEVFKDKHGFVIGGLPGIRYIESEVVLKPGAKLFIYTDGIPEATDGAGNMFGLERTAASLNDSKDGDPQSIIDNIRLSVEAFVGGAEQFDDLTMLVFEYKGSV